MKWNWGTKIGLLYTVFVLFILGMVYLAFNQKFDLVTEDYYAKEVAYQGIIDSKIRAENLNEKLTTSIDKEYLKISFPHENTSIGGTITCYRPSDESKDFSEEFSTDKGYYKIHLSKFISGKYNLKIKWNESQVEYYKEQTIIIP